MLTNHIEVEVPDGIDRISMNHYFLNNHRIKNKFLWRYIELNSNWKQIGCNLSFKVRSPSKIEIISKVDKNI